MNGECRCRKGSYGAYCQYKESDGSSVLVTLFQGAAFLLLGAIILALFYGAYMYLKRIVSACAIIVCRMQRRSALERQTRTRPDNQTSQTTAQAHLQRPPSSIV